MSRRPQVLAATTLVVVLVPLLGFGYLTWADEACMFDDRFLALPEGAGVHQSQAWWPPGGVRCEWDTPDGRTGSYVVSP